MSISEKEILRYLGVHNTTTDERIIHIIREIVLELEKRITPKSAYGIWDCRVDQDLVTLNDLAIHSSSLAKHLNECRYAALMAATLGVEADHLIRSYSVRDMEKAVVAQAVCTVMIEEYCDLTESEISMKTEDGIWYASGRFSPGYGDFDMAYQKDILRLLNGKRRIGLSLTDGNMLTPSKSVTAITGLSKEKKCHREKCEKCQNQKCTFKKE